MSAEFSPSQNSPLRRKTAGLINTLAYEFHKRFPALTADQITLAGVLGVTVASWVAKGLRKDDNHKRLASLGLMVGSMLLDALDGPIARITAKDGSENQNKVRGQIVDTAADRAQETFMSISRTLAAGSRGDDKGEVLAFLSGVSSVMPSFAKTFVEARGRVVPEAGNTPFGFFGTRAGRTGFAIASTIYPDINGMPLQKFLDGFTTFANLLTFFGRFKTAFEVNYDGKELSSEKVAEAKEKLRAMWFIVAGVMLSEGIAFYKIRKASN